MDATTCTIDGFGPLPVVRPGTVQELGELVRHASAIYPFGGQTQMSLGMPPTKPGTAIDMRGLADVIDFPARDMTITVQAGITVRTLCELLAKENLRLPIDVAHSDVATLGGILATNTSGPRRLGYGTLRDYVIGISAVNDEGREFKAGGRVVKNVAGYDLCKLLVGSLGTVGVITQVTLKLRPLAEHHAILCLGCESANLEAMLTRLHESRTRPVCIELLNPPAAQAIFSQAPFAVPAMPWTVLVGYEGNFDAVGWQVQQLVKEVGSQGSLQAYVDFTAQPLWDALIEFAAMPERGTAFKANLLPSATAGFCVSVDQEPNRPALCAHAGNGIVLGHWPSSPTMDSVASTLKRWRDLAAPGQGGVIVTACPNAWKPTLNVWGAAPNDAWLMREVKAKFDPRSIFNPGRFVDGI